MVIADFAPCKGALFPMKLSVFADAAVVVRSSPAMTNERKRDLVRYYSRVVRVTHHVNSLFVEF